MVLVLGRARIASLVFAGAGGAGAAEAIDVARAGSAKCLLGAGVDAVRHTIADLPVGAATGHTSRDELTGSNRPEVARDARSLTGVVAAHAVCACVVALASVVAFARRPQLVLARSSLARTSVIVAIYTAYDGHVGGSRASTTVRRAIVGVVLVGAVGLLGHDATFADRFLAVPDLLHPRDGRSVGDVLLATSVFVAGRLLAGLSCRSRTLVRFGAAHARSLGITVTQDVRRQAASGVDPDRMAARPVRVAHVGGTLVAVIAMLAGPTSGAARAACGDAGSGASVGVQIAGLLVVGARGVEQCRQREQTDPSSFHDTTPFLTTRLEGGHRRCLRPRRAARASRSSSSADWRSRNRPFQA